MTDIQIAAPLAAALASKGYETMTPVQNAMLEAGVAGRDLLVSAQTGSGKTVAFGIAIADELLQGADQLLYADTPMALVIAPTRELALQVARELDWLYGNASAKIATCVGGMDYRTEKRALDRGAHIVVGTPGRLRDHIDRKSLDLTGIRAVVLDEADEMLDLGFREDLEYILGMAPAERRTLMFSATVPKEIAALAKDFQRDALRIQTQGEARQHVDIEYRALSVAVRDREHAIFNLLRFYESQAAHRVLQDAGQCQPSFCADEQPGLSGGGAVGRVEPGRADPCPASPARWPGAGLHRHRRRGAGHRPAGAGSGDPCRSAVEFGNPAAPLGPHGSGRQQGCFGADRGAGRIQEGPAPVAGCQGRRDLGQAAVGG